MRKNAVRVLVMLFALGGISPHFGSVSIAHGVSAKPPRASASEVVAASRLIAQINAPERTGKGLGAAMRIGVENNVTRTFPILDTPSKQMACWMCYWADGIMVPNFYVFKKTTVRVAIPNALKNIADGARKDQAIVAYIEKEITQFHKKAFRNHRQASVHDVLIKKHGPHDYVVLSRYSLRPWTKENTMELTATLALAGLSLTMVLEAKKNPFRAFSPARVTTWATTMLAIAEFVRRWVPGNEELHLVRETVFR